MNKKNSGFSLVELIVVIAIMAVLVGVLAPAYLKYVEKSRKSADIDAFTEIMAAADKICVAPEFEDYIKANATFVVSTANNITATFTNATSATDDSVNTEWRSDANIDESGYAIKSKDFKKDENNITATGYVQSSGSIKWVCADTKAWGDYSTSFAGKFAAAS